jgi:hypothetical protein
MLRAVNQFIPFLMVEATAVSPLMTPVIAHAQQTGSSH